MKENAGNFVRELVDVPEKVEIAIRVRAVVVSIAFKKFFALVNPWLLLIVGGATSLLLTNAVWPKNTKVS